MLGRIFEAVLTAPPLRTLSFRLAATVIKHILVIAEPYKIDKPEMLKTLAEVLLVLNLTSKEAGNLKHSSKV